MYRKEGENLNLYNMLPFLEGWDMLTVHKTETVKKGVYKVVFSENCFGWLLGFDFASDDAHASVKLTYLGTPSLFTPYKIFITGGVEPPPSGIYTYLFLQPSTLSTAGVYVGSIWTSAYPFSVKGLVTVEVGLESSSTQSTATSFISFIAIRIVDKDKFLRSVRRFLYGWLGWAFGVLSNIPGLKYIGIPAEIKEVVG